MSYVEGLLSLGASLVFTITYGIVMLILPQKEYVIKKKGIFFLDSLIFGNMAIVFLFIAQKYGVSNVSYVFYTTALVLGSIYLWKVIEYRYLLKKKEIIYLFNSQFDSNIDKVDEYLEDYKSKYTFAVKYKNRALQIKFIDVGILELNEIINILESKGTLKIKSNKSRLISVLIFSVMLCSLLFNFIKNVL